MRSFFVSFLLVFLAVLPMAGADAPRDYNGHYELADAKADRVFSLDVKQIRQRAEVLFSASMTDGSGAAPEATGKGHVEDGVLSFKFKDNANNEGTCILQPSKQGYQLSITVTKVVDPRPFHFYGTVPLKRVSHL